jgi:putative redox protein
MNVELQWNEQLHFTAHAGGMAVELDARPPLGKGQGLTPKEMLLASLAGCTGMDVASLLKKHKQVVERLLVRVEAAHSEVAHPHVFTQARVVFDITGQVDPAVALDVVRASQSKFCGVSAVLSQVFPIRFDVIVNGTAAGSGSADFSRAVAHG